MSCLKTGFKAWSLAAGVLILVAVPGWASDKPAVLDPSLTLGDLRSFEVRSFESREYDSGNRSEVPPEIPEYTRTALESDDRVEYRSPGEGLLRFACEGKRCDRVRAEVTLGEDGPVLWQATEVYQTRKEALFSVPPDSRKLAKLLADRLAADYQKAMKAIPVKIEIRED